MEQSPAPIRDKTFAKSLVCLFAKYFEKLSMEFDKIFLEMLTMTQRTDD